MRQRVHWLALAANTFKRAHTLSMVAASRIPLNYIGSNEPLSSNGPVLVERVCVVYSAQIYYNMVRIVFRRYGRLISAVIYNDCRAVLYFFMSFTISISNLSRQPSISSISAMKLVDFSLYAFRPKTVQLRLFVFSYHRIE